MTKTGNPSILGTVQTLPEEDHIAIIRHIRFNETLHGGWNEWSVACICGELYEPRYDGWYIPSRQSAERIFNDHAGIQESTTSNEVEESLVAYADPDSTNNRETGTVYFY